ncbi:MAG: alpha/beta hydrolase [Rhodospirillales bacterium]|nr:alpha/beta hydrolase [Rhodospirillales bacterium]
MITTVAAVALGYVLVVGALYVFQRNLLFLPASHVGSPAAVGAGDMREVTLATADGLALRSWYKPASDDRPTMIYFHGNGGNISARAKRVRPYLNAGLGVLLVGYRGYGGNPGSPSEDGFYEDARAAARFIEAEGVANDKVVLYGESLGSAVAIHFAAEQAAMGKPVAAVIGEGAPSSVVDVAAKRYPFAPVRTLIKDRFDSRAKVGAIRAPLLLLHGEDDTVVPQRFGQALFDAAAEPKTAEWIDGAGHNNLTYHAIDAVVLEFLGRHVAPGQDAGLGAMPAGSVTPASSSAG